MNAAAPELAGPGAYHPELNPWREKPGNDERLLLHIERSANRITHAVGGALLHHNPWRTIMTHATTVRLKQLVQGTAINARTTGREDGISELASSIEAHGLILPLAVRRAGEDFEIVDGNRRFAALTLLSKDGKLAEDAAIPILIREDDDAGAHEASLAANTMRESLHPADQFEAFAKLRSAGRTIEKIATAFGVSVKTVKQRLALGTVIPEVLAAFREEKIDLEEVQAFTAVNAERQKAVWNELTKGRHMPSSWQIRDALRKNAISSKSALAKFVGAKAYEKAGGTIGHDLFQSESLWEDAALVVRLVREKVHGEIDKLLADGWSWAAVAEDLGENWQSWRRLYAEERYATPEDEARAAAIGKRQDEIYEIDRGKLPDDEAEKLETEWSELQEEEAEIHERMTEEYTPEQKKVSGVVILFDADDIFLRGFVKPGDAKAANKVTAGARGEAEDDQDEPNHGMGDSVVSDLKGVMTNATQIAIAANPSLAEAVLIVTLVRSLRVGYAEQCLCLSTREAYQAEGAFREQLREVLKGAAVKSNFGEAVAYIVGLTPKARAKLLAHLVAACLEKTEATSEIVKLANPKPEKIWRADEAFLKRLTKAAILDALTEAGCTEAAQKGGNAKKGELVLLAAKALAETKWLPKPLRAPTYAGPGEIPATQPMENYDGPTEDQEEIDDLEEDEAEAA